LFHLRLSALACSRRFAKNESKREEQEQSEKVKYEINMKFKNLGLVLMVAGLAFAERRCAE